MLKKDQSSWSCLMRAKFKKEKNRTTMTGRVTADSSLWLRKWKSVLWHTTDCFLTTCFLPKWPFVWIMAMGIENQIQIVQSIRILCIWDLSIPFVVEFFVWDCVLGRTRALWCWTLCLCCWKLATRRHSREKQAVQSVISRREQGQQWDSQCP